MPLVLCFFTIQPAIFVIFRSSRSKQDRAEYATIMVCCAADTRLRCSCRKARSHHNLIFSNCSVAAFRASSTFEGSVPFPMATGALPPAFPPTSFVTVEAQSDELSPALACAYKQNVSNLFQAEAVKAPRRAERKTTKTDSCGQNLPD